MQIEAIPVKHINMKVAGVDPMDCVRSNQEKKEGKESRPVFMCRVFGVVEGVKNFEDRKSGDVKTYFVGEFVAIGGDGKTYTSEKMFMFRALEEKLVAAFRSGGDTPTEFGYDISAIEDDKSATKYIYKATATTPTASSNRLMSIMKEVSKVPMPSYGTAVKTGTEKTEETTAPASDPAHSKTEPVTDPATDVKKPNKKDK